MITTFDRKKNQITNNNNVAPSRMAVRSAKVAAGQVRFELNDGTEERVRFPGLRSEELKALQKENAQLKKLIADQALDNAILKEAAKGNF